MVEGKGRPIGSLSFPIHEVALKDVRDIIAAEIGTYGGIMSGALRWQWGSHVGTFSSSYVFLSDGGT